MRYLIITVCLAVSTWAGAQNSEDFNKFQEFDFHSFTETIFGAKAQDRNEFLWKPNFEEQMSFAGQISEDGYCHTKLDTAMAYSNTFGNHTVLVYSTIKRDGNGKVDACRACAPIISIVTFQNEKDKSITVESFKKNLVSFGSDGGGGRYAIEKLGTSEYAISLQLGFCGQGECEVLKEYFLLNSRMFGHKIFTYYPEMSSEIPYKSVKTALRFIPNPNMSFANIELTQTVNRKVQPQKIKYRYEETAGVYVPVK